MELLTTLVVVQRKTDIKANWLWIANMVDLVSWQFHVSSNFHSFVNKMKVASYLIRLGSKGLGKDVTMPLTNATSVHVTKQFYNSLGQESDARLTSQTYDTTENKLQPERRCH